MLLVELLYIGILVLLYLYNDFPKVGLSRWRETDFGYYNKV